MHKLILMIGICLLAFACKPVSTNPTSEISDTLIGKDSSLIKPVSEDKVWVETHLKDSIEVSGNSVIFLRPDSLRYASFLENGNDHIHEVDSDFGFRVSGALDSIEALGLNYDVTEKRYLKIFDCYQGPIVIDRDTINYGVIFTSPDQTVLIDPYIESTEYLHEIVTSYYNNHKP